MGAELPDLIAPDKRASSIYMGLKCKSARIALIFFKTTKRGTFTGSSLQFALKNESKINFKDLPIQKNLTQHTFSFAHMPMHDVAPSAVRIAVATDAMICTIHFTVSFLVIIVLF